MYLVGQTVAGRRERKRWFHVGFLRRLNVAPEYRLRVDLTESRGRSLSLSFSCERRCIRCLVPRYTLCVHSWGQAHLFCRGSVLTGCNLQMLRPVGFIGTPLPSHYATLCPPLFSPPPAGPRRLSGYVPHRSAPRRASPLAFSPSNPSAALVRRS